MPPRGTHRKASAPTTLIPAPGPAGPHAGQASIRKAYEALGVQAFYAGHGSHYTNPHEAQIAAALARLLDAVPAAVWLGRQELTAPPDGAVAGGFHDDDSDDCEEEEEKGDGQGADDDEEGGGAAVGRGGGGVTGGGAGYRAGRHGEGCAATSGMPSDAGLQGPGSVVAAVPTAAEPTTAAMAVAAAAAVTAAHAAESAAAAASAVTRGFQPPVPLRVLDLACGSGEVTAALEAWNQHRAVVGRPAATTADATGEGGGDGASGPERASKDNAVDHNCHHHHHQQQQQRHRQHDHQQHQEAMHQQHEHRQQQARQQVHKNSPLSQRDQSQPQSQPQQSVPHAPSRRRRAPAAPPPAIPPYALNITACDPYTGGAYTSRTGRTALTWSFEDIADGCLADWEPPSPPPPPPATALAAELSPPLPPPSARGHTAVASSTTTAAAAEVSAAEAAVTAAAPHFDLVICSFALHLCDASRLYGTLTALSLGARWLVVLAPHKRPAVGEGHGWAAAAAWRLERTHVRLYRSLRVA